MIRFLIITTALFYSFISFAHNNETLLANKPIDSTFFKNRGIYATLSPFMLSSSINNDTKEHSMIFSGRLGVNWMTKKYRKFQVFGAMGVSINFFKESMRTNEFGFTFGKLYMDKNAGFWDLNVGLSYFERKHENFSFFGASQKASEVQTFGIPFDATFYGSKSLLGVGVGIAGNLNIEQPYVGLLFRIRMGNPVLKMHSTSKRKNSSKR